MLKTANFVENADLNLQNLKNLLILFCENVGTTHDLFLYEHTSPIIGNFQRLGLVPDKIFLGIVRKLTH